MFTALHPVACRLGEIFAAHNKELYLVGGSVRDALLGRPTQDLDFTTNALPDETRRLGVAAGADTVYTVGEQFGTIGFIFRTSPGHEVKAEITTFRTERYNPESRRPEVTFGTSLVDDLARRDFTINAIAQDASTGAVGPLIDPFGAAQDLAARLLRAVGNPDQRFQEDPLRLLRAIRFAAQLEFVIEPSTGRAIERNAALLARISRERIADELNRMLLAERPSRGFRLLANHGLLPYTLPELQPLRTTSQGHRTKNVFDHTLTVVDRTPRILTLRWAALLHDVGKPATLVESDGEVHFPSHERVGEELARKILGRLHHDKRHTERVARLVGLHMRSNQYEEDWTDSAVRRLIRDAGEDLGLLLDLSTADVTSYRPAKVAAALARVAALRNRIEQLVAEENVAALKSPLDGHDLIAMFGWKPGPWIGKVKNYLLEQVLEGKLAPDDRETAAILARKFVEESLAA